MKTKVTKHTIAKLHGILKRKPGAKPLADEWAEHKREESRIEESLPPSPKKKKPNSSPATLNSGPWKRS